MQITKYFFNRIKSGLVILLLVLSLVKHTQYELPKDSVLAIPKRDEIICVVFGVNERS